MSFKGIVITRLNRFSGAALPTIIMYYLSKDFSENESDTVPGGFKLPLDSIN